MNKTESAVPTPATAALALDRCDAAASERAADQPSLDRPLLDRPSLSPPPCFYWRWCAQQAAVEKAGRSVCRRCADALKGREYPLREPSQDRRNLFRLRTLVASTDLDAPI